MNKEDLIKIINDTLYKCENQYSWMIKDSVNIFYDEDHFKFNTLKPETTINIKMLNNTTVEALEILGRDKVYAVLNFASAKKPGGGVLNGAVAQEESLARASSLYPVIKNCVEFYKPTCAPDYSDKIIYSKPIFVFKNDNGYDIEPIECEVITCAATNYSFSDFNLMHHTKVMTKRFNKVLNSAIENNQRNIILGAWGCGVFKNPPEVNAQIFKNVINRYPTFFDDVIFAIPDDKNFQIFKDILE
jgi:uncharacterized protein (TIGR02452 family)